MMTKGVALIGCGFTPAQADVQAAIQQGYLKQRQTVALIGLETPVTVELALTTYLTIAAKKSWADPSGLEVIQFFSNNGRRVWCVYPLTKPGEKATE